MVSRSSSGDPLPVDGSGVVPSASEVPTDEPEPLSSESFSSSLPEPESEPEPSESLLRETSEPEPVSASESRPSESLSPDVFARSFDPESEEAPPSVEVELSFPVSLSADDPSLFASLPLAEPSSEVTPSVSADSLLSLSEPSTRSTVRRQAVVGVLRPPSAPASESSKWIRPGRWMLRTRRRPGRAVLR